MSSRLDRIQDWEEQARKAGYRASEMSRVASVSDRHLRRHFLKMFGLPPQEWIDRLRLRESQRLLLAGDMVKAVAYKLGYKHVSHFCFVFKRETGSTPSASTSARGPECPSDITNVRVA